MGRGSPMGRAGEPREERGDSPNGVSMGNSWDKGWGAQRDSVLAAAASNVAVDNLVERLVAANPKLRLVRVGSPRPIVACRAGQQPGGAGTSSDNKGLANDCRREMKASDLPASSSWAESPSPPQAPGKGHFALKVGRGNDPSPPQGRRKVALFLKVGGKVGPLLTPNRKVGLFFQDWPKCPSAPQGMWEGRSLPQDWREGPVASSSSTGRSVFPSDWRKGRSPPQALWEGRSLLQDWREGRSPPHARGTVGSLLTLGRKYVEEIPESLSPSSVCSGELSKSFCEPHVWGEASEFLTECMGVSGPWT
eukprot:jgi/Botrbrau1/19913/Bobra.0059s0030.1